MDPPGGDRLAYIIFLMLQTFSVITKKNYHRTKRELKDIQKNEDPFPNDWKGLLWLTWRKFSLSKDNANVEDIFADKY